MLIVKYNTAKNVHNVILFCFSTLIEETKNKQDFGSVIYLTTVYKIFQTARVVGSRGYLRLHTRRCLLRFIRSVRAVDGQRVLP